MNAEEINAESAIDKLALEIGESFRNRIKGLGGRKDFVVRTGVTESNLTRFFKGENVSSKTVFAIFEGAGLGHILKYLSNCDEVEFKDNDPLLVAIENLVQFSLINGREQEVKELIAKIISART